ncbi:hypothetical protein G9A89_008577 [Geosiphon pyriformis]|nr:hypothetical protein G9A89_008577 [Geosiphon pyriformis]
MVSSLFCQGKKEKIVGGRGVSTEVPNGCLWSSETGDTTKSESINMEEKCLIEETSFDYGKSSTITGGDHDQMPKGPGVKTKKALGKPLRKINFSNLDIDDDVLLNVPLKLPSPLKNLVSVSVRKSFALDIGLNKVLMVIRRLFSKVNSFGGVSTSSKFSGIICAFFTSEASLAQTIEKARAVNILVNTNLKKSNTCLDWAVVVKKILVGTSAEAVHAALSKFGIIKSIKIHLMGLTNAHDIWNFVRSVDGKIFRCTVVCFNSAGSLDATIRTIPVFRGTNLCWSSLVSAKCANCKKTDHISLSCAEGGKIFSVAHLVSFGGFSWAKIAGLPLFEHSFASFTEYVDMLVKRLKALGPIVSQLSPGCQPLITPLLQNQEADIVMNKNLGVATGGKTVVGAVIFNFSVIKKMENTLKNLAIMVMSFSAKINNAGLVSAEDVVCWHRESRNMIANKFKDVCVFMFGSDKGFLGTGVAVIMNNSLGKLSVTVLGLYTGASFETRFGQALEVNSVIAEAINFSTFVVLGEDFNENNSKKSATFKFCLDLDLFGLGDLFGVNHLVKMWSMLNSVKAHTFTDLVGLDKKSKVVLRHLSLVCKEYRRSKMYESRLAEETFIRLAISKHMENFCSDKGNMIKSVLDRLFCKVVLDYLVVDDELILESKEVKLNVDKIMKNWTRK